VAKTLAGLSATFNLILDAHVRLRVPSCATSTRCSIMLARRDALGRLCDDCRSSRIRSTISRSSSHAPRHAALMCWPDGLIDHARGAERRLLESVRRDASTRSGEL
jgi:hypothetical protein